ETENAIKTAQDTFQRGVWSDCTPQERANVLSQIADKMEANLESIIATEVENNGKTWREAEADATDAAGTFRYYASLLTTSNDEAFEADEGLQTMIVKEPIGVVGLIVPWNFPLLMSVWKIAPALRSEERRVGKVWGENWYCYRYVK